MADTKIKISQLATATAAADSDYLAIDNGSITKKITVANFNATGTAGAQYYAGLAQAAAASATATADAVQSKVDDAEAQAIAATAQATLAAQSALEAQGYDSIAQQYSNAANNAKDAALIAAQRAETAADIVIPTFMILNNRLYLKDQPVGNREFITGSNRLYVKIT